MSGEEKSSENTGKVDGGGLRHNGGKPRLDLVPNGALYALAKVMEYGAQKYEPHNWRRGMSWTSVTSCLRRHLLAFIEGEDLDEESGLPHTFHIMANAAFLVEFEQTCPELDDRYKGVQATKRGTFTEVQFNEYQKPEENLKTEGNLPDQHYPKGMPVGLIPFLKDRGLLNRFVAAYDEKWEARDDNKKSHRYFISFAFHWEQEECSFHNDGTRRGDEWSKADEDWIARVNAVEEANASV